ncbi:metal-binding protein [Streptomyces sp. NPDC059740]|uniref:metal-binding protein n=1 Tax=Streptomyces sp. NPDC059740 TaxID=3346926 RepID=UPI0036665F0E
MRGQGGDQATAARTGRGPATVAAGAGEGAATPLAAPASAGTGGPPTAGEVLARYLHEQSAEFLRGLRLHHEAGSDAGGTARAGSHLRRAARRVAGALHTFRPLTDEAWAGRLREELVWLDTTLGLEARCLRRREQLTGALHRLVRDGAGHPSRLLDATGAPPGTRPAHASDPAAAAETDGGGTVPAGTDGGSRPTRRGATVRPGQRSLGQSSTGPQFPAPDGTAAGPAQAALAAGTARAGALLDRQSALACTRAHSAALQALQSSRFHALADAVAVLASEVPLSAAADAPAAEAVPPLVQQAYRLVGDALADLTAPDRTGPQQRADRGPAPDAPWRTAGRVLGYARYAQEVLDHCEGRGDGPRAPAGPGEAVLPAGAGRLLERHLLAADAATAAAEAARTPRISPATAYALGVLHADQRQEAEAARAAFTELWLRARTPTGATGFTTGTGRGAEAAVLRAPDPVGVPGARGAGAAGGGS